MCERVKVHYHYIRIGKDAGNEYGRVHAITLYWLPQCVSSVDTRRGLKDV